MGSLIISNWWKQLTLPSKISHWKLLDLLRTKFKFICLACLWDMCENVWMWNPKTCLTCVCNRADVSQGLAELRKWPKLLHNRAVKLFLKHSQKHSFHKTCTLKLAAVAPKPSEWPRTWPKWTGGSPPPVSCVSLPLSLGVVSMSAMCNNMFDFWMQCAQCVTMLDSSNMYNSTWNVASYCHMCPLEASELLMSIFLYCCWWELLFQELDIIILPKCEGTS